LNREDLARFGREVVDTHSAVEMDKDEIVGLVAAEHVCEQTTDPKISEWECPCGKAKVLMCDACSEPLRIGMDWENPCEHGLELANALAGE
jgi:hypothetical protein